MPETYFKPNDAENEALLEGAQMWWKPQSNTTTSLRIGPPWSEKGHLFRVTALHYNLGTEDERVLFNCGNVHGDGNCPACRMSQKLFNGNKMEKALARKLRATYRYNFNVIVRGQETLGWRIWAAPKTVAEAILSIAKTLSKEKKAHFTDPEHGRDINLSAKGEGINREYIVQPAFEESPIGYDGKLHDLSDAISINLLPNSHVESLVKRFVKEGLPNA